MISHIVSDLDITMAPYCSTSRTEKYTLNMIKCTLCIVSIRDRRQISLLILTEFEQSNDFCSPEIITTPIVL